VGEVNEARARYYSTHFKTFQPPGMDDLTFEYYQDKLGSTFPAAKDARVLEIGCGLGKFLATLERLGYTRLEGVDVSAEMVASARQNTRAPVTLTGDVRGHLGGLPDGAFDRVYMLDVIEHIDKAAVVDVLMALRAKVAPAGALIVTTENMASPIGRIQRYLDFTHEYNYTDITLRQVLEIAGFGNVRTWTPPDPPPRPGRRLVTWMARRLWFEALDVLHRIERPGGTRPAFYDKDLIATATL
jgi:2-polyprenyl-3-methyl-5-hydroxy-6-metoxy-1,4-benzoquinol methylase